jgi:hypothetical protein
VPLKKAKIEANSSVHEQRPTTSSQQAQETQSN